MMEPSISIPSDWLRFALTQQDRRDGHCWVTGRIERDGMLMHDLPLEVVVNHNFEFVNL